MHRWRARTVLAGKRGFAVSTKDVVYIALFAAVTAALALFPALPLSVTGVPITAQSMGPMLAGSIVGWKRGTLSQLLFLVLAAIGLPVLAGGTGGLGVFAGPNGGYLVGWVVTALVVGWLFERCWARLNIVLAVLIIAFGGIVILYAIGSGWIALSTQLSYGPALVTNAPFLLGDVVKVLLCAVIAMAVKRAYPIIEPSQGAHDQA